MKAFNIEKILIPIDFSETSLLAIEHAGFMAQLFKAELILLHVVEKHWEHFEIISPELRVAPPTDLTNLIEKKLDETAEDIRSKYGVKSKVVTSSGTIFNEIFAVSKEYNVDLVVMGTHGVSGIAEFFIGSNTFKMVTKSECPVISVQAHAKKLGFTDILLPIDDSAHSRQKVNYAIELAAHFGSRLHIVGIANEEVDEDTFVLKIKQVEEYIASSGIGYTSKIINGNNQAKITEEYADKVNADLIVIMTDQDENVTGRLMGTFAQQVVNHSKIPVMSIQPKVVDENMIFGHPH